MKITACLTCGGKGRIFYPQEHGIKPVDCPACGGSGKVISVPVMTEKEAWGKIDKWLKPPGVDIIMVALKREPDALARLLAEEGDK